MSAADTDKQSSKKKRKEKALPEPLETQRTHVLCTDKNYHPSTVTSASAYLTVGVDNSWDFKEFADDFDIVINRLDEESMEFDLIGVDPAIANALRRILIAEVPTVCIEHVFFVNNTSIIQDEVLAHRLGMVPLRIDPALLVDKTKEEAPSDKNTVVFKLNVTCSKDQHGAVVNDKVLSSHLEWLPYGSELPDETSCRFASGQDGMFAIDDPPRACHDDILLAKMRPGQSIELEAHCIRGTGREHAKWSPVATAWYRLQPEVVLLKEADGDMAEELADLLPGLLTVEEVRGRRWAVVGEARQHEQLLEKVRRLAEEDKWREVVQVRKRKDHFIFTIESTGALRPEQLFTQALQLLSGKADKLSQRLG